MIKKVIALSGFVMIKPFEPLKETETGIIIPDIALEKPSKGTIVEVSKKCKLGLTKGENVFYSLNAATVFTLFEERLVIIREASIIGKI